MPKRQPKVGGKPKSGGARLMAAKKRPMLLGLTADQREKIEAAAAADGRPMAQFVLWYALQAADAILKKSADSA